MPFDTVQHTVLNQSNFRVPDGVLKDQAFSRITFPASKTEPTTMTAAQNNSIVLLATGGTGGHIFPAVALARSLETRGFQSAIIGGRGGMEESIAASEGLKFFGVRTGKLDRSKPDPRAVLRALAGFKDALGIVSRTRPAAVVGFGGFASFPGAASAILRGVPLVLHDSNARPGIVTKFLGHFAKFIALAENAAQNELPRGKTVWVGMPVREVRVPKAEALEKLGLEPDKPLVLIIGGSQGSMRLNKLLPPILEKTLTGKGVQVLHQTGQGRLGEVKPRVSHLPWYHCIEFVDGPVAWSAADVGITRAGASTISDAAYHGVPLVLIPLPSSAEDHQTRNALAVQARGAGICVPERDLEEESRSDSSPSGSIDSRLPGPLASGMVSCLQPERHQAMRAAALGASPEGAAERLAALVLKAMQGSSLRSSGVQVGGGES
jgi:UDP-N-acetylglucosamine--N-acetylmuramyl-(pentapeptide) pyrophosphoryl-undecaprenol N-acetylglucosamine transferase